MFHTIRYDQNLSMEMRDGVKLAGEVYRPGGEREVSGDYHAYSLLQ